MYVPSSHSSSRILFPLPLSFHPLTFLLALFPSIFHQFSSTQPSDGRSRHSRKKKLGGRRSPTSTPILTPAHPIALHDTNTPTEYQWWRRNLFLIPPIPPSSLGAPDLSLLLGSALVWFRRKGNKESHSTRTTNSRIHESTTLLITSVLHNIRNMYTPTSNPQVPTSPES